MKKVLKFISMLFLLFIVFITFMSIKTQRDFDTKHKQIIHGNKKGKDMSYCNTRAGLGIEDYTSCMQRMKENYK